MKLLHFPTKGSHVLRAPQGYLKTNDPRRTSNKRGSQPGFLFRASPPDPTQRFDPNIEMSLLHSRLHKLSFRSEVSISCSVKVSEFKRSSESEFFGLLRISQLIVVKINFYICIK